MSEWYGAVDQAESSGVSIVYAGAGELYEYVADFGKGWDVAEEFETVFGAVSAGRADAGGAQSDARDAEA